MFTLFISTLFFNISYVNQEKFPIVISPKTPNATYDRWGMVHKREVRELLEEHGAVLLRDCGVKSADDFASLITTVLGHEPSDYKGGEGSRKKVIEGVYTSTEAPSEFKIPLHNELSCTNDPPHYISFFCERAPAAGTGQTLLGKTAEVTHDMMDSRVWNIFNGKQLRYTSRHPSEGSFFSEINPTHKSWQEAFETKDPAEVEKTCREKGFEFQWHGSWLEVVRTVPAVHKPDAHFSYPYWFNQAHLYHWNPRKHGGYLNDFLAHLLYMEKDTRPYDIEFSDGSQIESEVMYEVYDILDGNTIYFDWQSGDVLILDNFRTMHGRAPYDSPRRVLAAFTN